MNRTLVTVVSTIAVLAVLSLALLCLLPWQAVSTFLLLLLSAWIAVIALRPTVFLSPPKANSVDDETLAAFQAVLKNVFTPDTVLISTNTSRPYQILIDKESFIIGRDTGCDYVLPLGNEISRQHVCICYNSETNEYSAMDMGSSNGTLLNGERMQPNHTYPLHNDDMLAFAGIPFAVKSAYY